MRWGDAEPGDLVEYKLPGSLKKYGIFLGIVEQPEMKHIHSLKWISILGSEHEMIPIAVDLDNIPVSVRSSLAEAVG